jgi:hypothetical protein
MTQKTVLFIQIYFATKKRSTPKNPTGWTMHYDEKQVFLEPEADSIEDLVKTAANKVDHYHAFYERGEIDRNLMVKAFYPERQTNGQLGYYGETVAEYDFNAKKVIFK